MEHLQEELRRLLAALPTEKEVLDRLQNLVSVYPFNEYEYIISTLLAMDVLTLDDYYQLRDEYISRNLYLYIFEISSPRTAWLTKACSRRARRHVRLIPAALSGEKKMIVTTHPRTARESTTSQVVAPQQLAEPNKAWSVWQTVKPRDHRLPETGTTWVTQGQAGWDHDRWPSPHPDSSGPGV